MSALSIPAPFPIFSDTTGAPLDGGYIYIGAANQDPVTNPIAAYWDAALTIPAVQPIRTSGGYPVYNGSPTNIYVNTDYSIRVNNSNGVFVYSAPTATARLSGIVLTGVDSANVSYLPAGTGAVATDVQTKLRELRTAGDNPTWGSRSVGVGINNFTNGSAAVENTALGSDNLKTLTSGYANTAIGVDVLAANTSGAFNIGCGVKTLFKNTTGMGNTAFGAYSTYENKAGSGNTAYGEDSNRYLDGGSGNVAVGTQSLYNNVTGTQNTAVGTYAARNAANPPDDGAGTGPSPTYITAVGANSLYAAAGTLNTGVGYSAGYNTTGSYNTYLGSNSGYRVVGGAYNVFLGYNAGQTISQNAAASYCVAVGRESYTTGDNAIAIGNAVFAGANQCVIGNIDQTDVFFYGNINTQSDNLYDIGSGAGRFKTIYATTGTINTSDEREKQDISALNAAELRVATALKGMVKKFKYKDAVQAKGSAARIHIGVIAQEVMSAFSAEGLDSAQYGIICYDEWGERPEVVLKWDAEYGNQGKLIREAGSAIAQQYRPAGNRYGVRYEELLAFIIAAL